MKIKVPSITERTQVVMELPDKFMEKTKKFLAAGIKQKDFDEIFENNKKIVLHFCPEIQSVLHGAQLKAYSQGIYAVVEIKLASSYASEIIMTKHGDNRGMKKLISRLAEHVKKLSADAA